MTGIPTYKAAVVGGPGNAGTTNQFLMPHDTSIVYDSATLQASATTGSGVYTSTESQYLSQQFLTTSAQTTISQVWLQISAVNGSAITNNIDPLTVGIYADSGGEPIGSPLGSASLVETAVYLSGFWVIVPLTVSGLTASTPYHIVVGPAGDATSYYVWQRNNLVAGAATSPDLIAWTDQAYGFMYQVYDASATGGSEWAFLVEDGGARWSQYTYTSSLVTGTTEYTVDQTGSGSTEYIATLTYSGNLLTGIS